MGREVKIDSIANWFKKAVPNPNQRNIEVQLGCHFEEIAEMLVELESDKFETSLLLSKAYEVIHNLADDLKSGEATLTEPHSQVGLLDAMADQIVTAIGVAHMQGMGIVEAIDRVDRSNWSKFDSKGNPIFNENGKIMKGPAYHKPELSDLV